MGLIFILFLVFRGIEVRGDRSEGTIYIYTYEVNRQGYFVTNLLSKKNGLKTKRYNTIIKL